MLNEDIRSKINSRYNLFTKAEKRVADFILRDSKRVIDLTITDLASICHVGDASVFRFCKTMQLSGYQELKRLLLNSHQNDISDMWKPIQMNKNDSISALAAKALKVNTSILKETYDMINYEEFSRVVDCLHKAENIYFFGAGASLITAMEGVDLFLNCTPKVHCITDGHIQAMAAALLTPNDLAFAISYSGETESTIHTIRLARETGAMTVVLTRFPKSTIMNYADIALLCVADERTALGRFKPNRISQSFLLELLYREYSHRISRNENDCI